MASMLEKMKTVLVDAEKMMPGYFTTSRINKLKDLYRELDADDELSLDMNEMMPFFESAFQLIFGVELTYEHMESLFHIIDADASTESKDRPYNIPCLSNSNNNFPISFLFSFLQ